jgi:inorganic pyrophosphatase
MVTNLMNPIAKLMGLRYESHPWHGVEIGNKCPEILTTFIEVVPSDTVKYEIDKVTGYLKIDRPQKFSNVVPALYGFIPQTYCNDKVAAYSMEKSGKEDIKGDKDPLDICVLTEKVITHGNILVQAIPIGGLRMIDGNEADDKIIAVLKDDAVFGSYKDISDVSKMVIDRLKHYFLTYKNLPGEVGQCEITQVYGKKEAHEVIQKSVEDYQAKFDFLETALSNV